MSTLIDSFLGDNVKTEIDGRWYVAKPLPFYSIPHTVRTRVKGAWRVLTGRAIAVHFKEDERSVRGG